MNICSLLLISFFSFFAGNTTYVADGKASFYADKMHGKPTSSGERYDKTLLTAAHASLPFNTYVKVKNLKNGKSVIVKINDRMAKSRHTIIDVSKAAAQELEMVRAGVASVKVEEVAKSEVVQQEASSNVSEKAHLQIQ